jgi:hypothetical protein
MREPEKRGLCCQQKEGVSEKSRIGVVTNKIRYSSYT